MDALNLSHSASLPPPAPPPAPPPQCWQHQHWSLCHKAPSHPVWRATRDQTWGKPWRLQTSRSCTRCVLSLVTRNLHLKFSMSLMRSLLLLHYKVCKSTVSWYYDDWSLCLCLCDIDDWKSEEILVPDKMVGLIIGRGGDVISKLQIESGAKIQMAPDSQGQPERLVEFSSSAIIQESDCLTAGAALSLGLQHLSSLPRDWSRKLSPMKPSRLPARLGSLLLTCTRWWSQAIWLPE